MTIASYPVAEPLELRPKRIDRMIQRQKVRDLRARFRSISFAYHNPGDGPMAWMLAEYGDGETDQPGDHIIATGSTRANCLRRILNLPRRA